MYTCVPQSTYSIFIFRAFSNNLNRSFARPVQSSEGMQNNWYFPSVSSAFVRTQAAEFDARSSYLHPPRNSSPVQSLSPIPCTTSTQSYHSSALSDSEAVTTQKGKKSRVKSADWTEEEATDLLEAWGPKYKKLRGASQREKIKLWNEIYSVYKTCYPDSQRTLAQVKKRQQNLEYEFKQLN